MPNKVISTLEYYNYFEQNNFKSSRGEYKVKVSDKEGNIITLEKDGSLFAMVGLALNGTQLTLLDKAHDDSVLAEIDFPNAGKITNCRFNEDTDSIEFDILTLDGETQAVSIDVQSLVDVYEAGNGIEIGDKSPETGKKPISIRLADGESLLKVDSGGLGLDDKVATDDEVAEAVSGKADIEYVDAIFSGLTDEIEHIIDVLGTDETDPSISEKLDLKADLEDVVNLEENIGEIEVKLSGLTDDVETLEGRVDAIENEISGVTSIIEKVDEISGNVEALSAKVEDNEVFVYKITSGLPDNVREAYIIVNNLGEQLGERIDIYKDSTIVSIEYIPDLQIIRYVYIDAEGQTQTVDIDLSQIVIESEFADGLQVNEGVVSVKIDPTSDSYISVSENGIKLSGIFNFFQQLLEVNSQQWAAITGEAARAQDVEGQLWTAINNEATERQNADNSLGDRINGVQSNLDEEARIREDADNNLSDLIDEEKERAIARENEIENSIDEKVNAEKERAEAAENALSGAIDTEKAARERADNALSGAIDTEKAVRERADNALSGAIEEEISDRRNADLALSDRITEVDNKITDFDVKLSAETDARIQRDEELASDIAEIQETYVTKEYVDNRDAQVLTDAINSAVTDSNRYTDNSLDDLEIELKEYSDNGDLALSHVISSNTTKINAISNLRGVVGDDTSNYDDSGNGILDVLHREFHEFEKNYGTIESIEVVDGNFIITYITKTGEKQTVIPISEILILDDYYTKEETDEKINEAIQTIILDDFYTKEEVDEKLDEKLDVSAFTSIDERVSANTNSIANLFDKLGYANNDTLVTTNPNEVAFGKYNVSNADENPSGQTVFSVGIGTSAHDRKNAFEVRENGDIYIWVEGDYMCINPLLGMLAHEIY